MSGRDAFCFACDASYLMTFPISDLYNQVWTLLIYNRRPVLYLCVNDVGLFLVNFYERSVSS